MRKKKNRFLLFCFSFLPGAGEMYFGFMKMGISLLSLFAVCVMVTGYMQIGVLMFVPFVVWVYSFFHANNLGALSDEEFYRIQDDYLFGFDGRVFAATRDSVMRKYRKALAMILILLGITMLWQSFCRVLRHIFGSDFYFEYISRYTGIISDDIPRVIVALVIIWFGVKLIRGKKEELDRLEESGEQRGPASGNKNGMMSGAAGNEAGFAGKPVNDIPVERIEQVEVIDNAAENNGNV